MSDVTALRRHKRFSQWVDQRDLHLKSLLVVWYSGITVNPEAYVWDFLCCEVNVCSISTPIVYKNASDQSGPPWGVFRGGETNWCYFVCTFNINGSKVYYSYFPNKPHVCNFSFSPLGLGSWNQIPQNRLNGFNQIIVSTLLVPVTTVTEKVPAGIKKKSYCLILIWIF